MLGRVVSAWIDLTECQIEGGLIPRWNVDTAGIGIGAKVGFGAPLGVL
jgi:hypothetical protein